MAEKKKSSCFGMFLKSTIVSSLLFANLTAAFAIIHVKFFSGNLAAWTDFSTPTSRPFLAIYAVVCLGLGFGVFVGLAGAALSAFFSGSSKKSSSSSRPRPQSNRKTTI